MPGSACVLCSSSLATGGGWGAGAQGPGQGRGPGLDPSSCQSPAPTLRPAGCHSLRPTEKPGRLVVTVLPQPHRAAGCLGFS